MSTKLEPEDSDAEDYELLASDPQTVDGNLQKDNMGLEKEFEKKEGRKGDSFASYAALVSPVSHFLGAVEIDSMIRVRLR